jgi:hypothetical protein
MAFSLGKFLVINTGDKKLHLRNDNNSKSYTVSVFNVSTSYADNNLLKIKERGSNTTIACDFSTSNEARQALGLFQLQVDVIRSLKPHILDKGMKNYVDSEILDISPGPVGPQGATGSIESVELLGTYSATASVIEYDFSSAGTWYQDNLTSNYTADIINVPTTDNRVSNVSIIVAQGATAYAPTVLQIDGATQSIKWLNGTYSVNASQTDVVAFKLVRTGATWSQVLGQINTFN